VTIEAKIA